MISVYWSSSFNKRENDCKRPYVNPSDPSDTDYDYSTSSNWKDSTSIVNPTIIIDRGTFDASGHARPTYCYIPDFDNRYYFVRDFRYVNATIEIDLECDVLATYKVEISNSKQYILRSSNRFNTYLQDTMYPAQSNINILGTPIPSPWKQTFNEGCVSFGVVGSGATTYYIMDKIDFEAFVNYLLSNAYATAVIGAMGLSAYPQYKMTINPLQYLTALMWIPLAKTDIVAQSGVVSNVSHIEVGAVDVDMASIQLGATACYQILNGSYRYVWNCGTNSNVYTLYEHPLVSSRGKYLDLSPWTQMQIFFPPFGVIDIDTVGLNLAEVDSTTSVYLQVTVNIDLRTGSATLTLTRFSMINNVGQRVEYLTSLNSQVGVQFEIGQVISPGYGVASYITTAAGAVAGIAGVATSAVIGNAAGAVGSAAGTAETVVSGIGDVIASKIPMARSIGGTGGVDALRETPYLCYQFYYPTDEARAELGRVYCKEDYIYNMQGFVLCRNAHGTFGKTLEEKRKIIYYMNTGFFYGDYT